MGRLDAQEDAVDAYTPGHAAAVARSHREVEAGRIGERNRAALAS